MAAFYFLLNDVARTILLRRVAYAECRCNILRNFLKSTNQNPLLPQKVVFFRKKRVFYFLSPLPQQCLLLVM